MINGDDACNNGFVSESNDDVKNVWNVDELISDDKIPSMQEQIGGVAKNDTTTEERAWHAIDNLLTAFASSNVSSNIPLDPFVDVANVSPPAPVF